MGRAFLVRGPPALAGYLTLLIGRHRGESTTLFAYSVHGTPPGFSAALCGSGQSWSGLQGVCPPRQKGNTRRKYLRTQRPTETAQRNGNPGPLTRNFTVEVRI